MQRRFAFWLEGYKVALLLLENIQSKQLLDFGKTSIFSFSDHCQIKGSSVTCSLSPRFLGETLFALVDDSGSSETILRKRKWRLCWLWKPRGCAELQILHSIALAHEPFSAHSRQISANSLHFGHDTQQRIAVSYHANTCYVILTFAAACCNRIPMCSRLIHLLPDWFDVEGWCACVLVLPFCDGCECPDLFRDNHVDVDGLRPCLHWF